MPGQVSLSREIKGKTRPPKGSGSGGPDEDVGEKKQHRSAHRKILQETNVDQKEKHRNQKMSKKETLPDAQEKEALRKWRQKRHGREEEVLNR